MSFKVASSEAERLLQAMAQVLSERPNATVREESVQAFCQSHELRSLADAFIAQAESHWRTETPIVVGPQVVAASEASVVVGNREITVELVPKPADVEPAAPVGEGGGAATAIHDPVAAAELTRATSQPAVEPLEVASTDAVLSPAEPPPMEVSAVELAQPPAPEPLMRRYPSVRFQTLANATVGEAYDAPVAPTEPLPLKVIAVGVPEGVALSFDAATGRLSGVPALAGEHTLTVAFRFDDEPEEIAHDTAVGLGVNADPRSLWNDIPSDPRVAFHKPDTDQQQLATGDGGHLVAASRRGRSHAHKGTCRDDDFFIGHINGWRIGVVADGAGSAQYSRQGAKVAAAAAGESLLRSLTEDAGIRAALTAYAHDGAGSVEVGPGRELKTALYQTVGHAAFNALQAVKRQLGALPTDAAKLGDFNTTLLIAVSKTLPEGTLVGTYSVGDGAIGLLTPNEVRLGGAPDGGEYSGGTRFLADAYVTQTALWERTWVHLLTESPTIALMTDGVSDAKFKSDRALEDRAAWDALLTEVGEATGFPAAAPDLDTRLVEWLNFWVKGEHDDRTLALIW